jgi:hypothetical protein
MQIPGWRGGDGDAAYLDKTLRYQNVELSLDERVDWKIILRLFARAFMATVFVWPVIAFLGLLVYGAGGDPSAIFVLGYTVQLLAFWVVLLFSKLPEPIAEWRVLLSDRVDAAASVYSQIVGTMTRRQLPINASCHRIRIGVGPHQVSNRLVLRNGSYIAYVSVFSYGTSLYLGWVMWRTRRGAALVKQFLTDVVGAIFGWNDPERLMLRTEQPRAMREALHSACREGLFVAVEGADIPVQYGFPSGMPPVDDGVVHGAPMPQAPQAPQALPRFDPPPLDPTPRNDPDRCHPIGSRALAHGNSNDGE